MGRGALRPAPANRRLSQRRRRRHVRFDAAAQAAYLGHFAANGDSRAAAAAAGVSVSTVRLHRRTNSVFAEAHKQASAEAYDRLEAEALRQRLAAQKRLRAAIEAAEPDPPPELAMSVPSCLTDSSAKPAIILRTRGKGSGHVGHRERL